MTQRTLRVLLVEDSPGDARLVEETLADSGDEALEIEHVLLLSEALKRLASGSVDVVLLDLLLPDNMGPDTVQKIVQAAPWVPVVVLSGVDDEESAEVAIRLGAFDYLVKGDLEPSELARTLRQAVAAKSVHPRTGPPATGPIREPERPVPPPRTQAPPLPDLPLEQWADKLRAAGDHELAERLERLAGDDARIRAFIRTLAEYMAALLHRPTVVRASSTAAFDDALVRLQEQIIDDEIHVRRATLHPVASDPILLTRLFGAALATSRALHLPGPIVATLDSEPYDGRIYFTLTARRDDGRWSPQEARPDAPREPAARVEEGAYPELLIAQRLAARLGGGLTAEVGRRGRETVLRFALTAAGPVPTDEPSRTPAAEEK